MKTAETRSSMASLQSLRALLTEHKKYWSRPFSDHRLKFSNEDLKVFSKLKWDKARTLPQFDYKFDYR